MLTICRITEYYRLFVSNSASTVNDSRHVNGTILVLSVQRDDNAACISRSLYVCHCPSPPNHKTTVTSSNAIEVEIGKNIGQEIRQEKSFSSSNVVVFHALMIDTNAITIRIGKMVVINHLPFR